MSFVEMWSQMGVAARLIFTALVAFACATGYVVVERALTFRRLGRAARPLTPAERGRLRRHLHTLAAIKVTAPMIGLLGTLIGLINALTGIARTGAFDLRAASTGIAEALVTTVLGLMVGLPAWWAHGALTAWRERLALPRG